MDDETQDEEDLLSQSLQVNPQGLDAAAGASSLAQLSNLMNTHHPQLLAKFRLEVSKKSLFILFILIYIFNLSLASHLVKYVTIISCFAEYSPVDAHQQEKTHADLKK